MVLNNLQFTVFFFKSSEALQTVNYLSTVQLTTLKHFLVVQRNFNVTLISELHQKKLSERLIYKRNTHKKLIN